MQPLTKRALICTLIFLFWASQAAAFDIRIGPTNFNPAAGEQTGRHQDPGSSFGAMVSIPLGSQATGRQSGTLNGQDLANFTKQDAKDSAIVIMLFGVAIAAGALSISVSAN